MQFLWKPNLIAQRRLPQDLEFYRVHLSPSPPKQTRIHVQSNTATTLGLHSVPQSTCHCPSDAADSRSTTSLSSRRVDTQTPRNIGIHPILKTQRHFSPTMIENGTSIACSVDEPYLLHGFTACSLVNRP